MVELEWFVGLPTFLEFIPMLNQIFFSGKVQFIFFLVIFSICFRSFRRSSNFQFCCGNNYFRQQLPVLLW